MLPSSPSRRKEAPASLRTCLGRGRGPCAPRVVRDAGAGGEVCGGVRALHFRSTEAFRAR